MRKVVAAVIWLSLLYIWRRGVCCAGEVTCSDLAALCLEIAVSSSVILYCPCSSQFRVLAHSLRTDG